MSTVTRVIIADDHALFRQGLKSLLAMQRGIEVVAEVTRADGLAATLEASPCDVLLLDLQMERWMLDKISSVPRTIKVIVLTASESLDDAVAALRAGARAIVQKRFAIENLLEAIKAT